MHVTLSWNVSNGAAGYKIYYDTVSSASGPPYNGTGAAEGPSPIDVKNETQFTLHNLLNAGYRFAITAYNNNGESNHSAEKVLSATLYALTTDASAGGSVTPGSGSYSGGVEVHITAVPDPGWVFSGWSGDLNDSTNPATIIMDSNKSVTAGFTRTQPEYALKVITSGQGSVSPSSGTYETGSEVSLSATAAQGWKFNGWSGDLGGTSNPLPLIMDSEKLVMAEFTQPMPVINGFLANPEHIDSGDTATLTWEITQADTASIDNGIGEVDPLGGAIEVAPLSTTTYTLTATNSAGSTSSTVIVGCISQSATLPFNEDFESGALSDCWEIHSTGAGRTLLSTSGDPLSGRHHLTMDSSRNRKYSLNEAILTIDLSGQSGVVMSFLHKEFKDENHVMPDSFTGSHNSDGVAISADGMTWYKVQGLTGSDGISSNGAQFEVDLDSAVTACGIKYNNKFKIKFQQYDNYPIGNDGFALDDVMLDIQ